MSRKNISLHEEIDRRAEAIIAARGFAGLSDLIAGLIREEYERRGLDKPETLRDGPVSAAQQAENDRRAAEIVETSYTKKKKPPTAPPAAVK